jgi:hypothetical protein
MTPLLIFQSVALLVLIVMAACAGTVHRASAIAPDANNLFACNMIGFSSCVFPALGL